MPLSLIFGWLIPLVSGGEFSVFFTLGIFCFISLLRFLDDFFDYENDRGRKQQYLSKNALLVLITVSAILFVAFNCLAFGLWGLLCILFLGYALLEERFTFLQSFLMLLFSLYAILLTSRSASINIPSWIFLGLSLILPILFGIYKRSKRK